MYLAENQRSYQSEPSHPDSEQDHALTTACVERVTRQRLQRAAQ